MRRHLCLAVLASTFAASGAHAQPPYPTPFQGAYIGGVLGFGSQHTETLNLTQGAPSTGATFKDDDGGVTVGGYAGYNWQPFCNPFLFGIETDINYLNSSPTAVDVETGPAVETSTFEGSNQWFGTFRGRLGWVVHEDWLLYATGGLAYGGVKHTWNDDCVDCSAPGPFNFGPFTQSNTDSKLGWTAGGGAEFLHDSNWRIRAEALFVDLGSATHSYLVPACNAALGPSFCTATLRWDDQFWVARLGLSYGFGGTDGP
jgi:outer membrane immunogenic protein